MPSVRELQRGIKLGVYRDPEKAARDERQVQVAEQRANLADQREIRAGANDDERTRLDRLRFERAELTAKAAESAEARVLEDSISATKKLVGIAATTADFPQRLQQIIAEHPRALADKAFQEQYNWNTNIHKEWQGQQQVSAKMKEEERIKAAEKKALQVRFDTNLDKLTKMPGGKLKSASLSAAGEVDPVIEFGNDPSKVDATQKAAQVRYENALKLRMNPGLSKSLASKNEGERGNAKNQADYLDQEMTAAKALLGTAAPPQAPPAAPAAGGATKPKVVRQNGVTYTLQEDGSYK